MEQKDIVVEQVGIKAIVSHLPTGIRITADQEPTFEANLAQAEALLKMRLESLSKHQPNQPVVLADDNIIRFKENPIVRALLDAATQAGVMDLNKIACMDFTDEDRAQFAQLIGYSVGGYDELHYTAGRRSGPRKAAEKIRQAFR